MYPSSWISLGCISGWGNTGEETSTDKLQKTVVPIVETSNCVERMDQTEDLSTDLILCAGGGKEGPCKVMTQSYIYKHTSYMMSIYVSINFDICRVTVVDHLQL